MPLLFPIHRVLPLDGGNGSVMCRMHLQETSRTIPRKSPKSRIEFATRSLLRMKNLTAVRGGPGQSMVGPADYYTNLEKPEKCHYTIQIDNGIPQFTENQAPSATPGQKTNLTPIANNMMTRVNVNWVSGQDKSMIQSTQAHYASTNPSFGESLFPNPGILEIKSASDCVALPNFDPRNMDLLPFKARLVANNAPFRITSVPLPEHDEYRAVSYLYEEGYASNQIKQGGGLFLETHEFSQTITPLDTNAKGFVSLGKWNEAHDALDLIAVHIPYGYTLIIDRDCIHGDATLNGMFMMCMTSNHLTMEKANTVFLKHPLTKKNITLTSQHNQENYPITTQAPGPYVIYKTDTNQKIKAMVAKMNKWDLIFNPFSIGFWKVSTCNMKTQTAQQLIGGALIFSGIAAITGSLILPLGIAAITGAFLPLGIVMLASFIAAAAVIVVVGCGFFANGTAKKIIETMRNNELPTHSCMA